MYLCMYHCTYMCHFVFRVLSEQPETLVWKYIDPVLVADQEIGVSVLIDHEQAADSEFIDKALNILRIVI